MSCFNLDDIEDLHLSSPMTSSSVKPTNRGLLPRQRKQQKQLPNNSTPYKEPVIADSLIPGTQSIYVKTWGCAHNTSDGEYMAGLLSAYGYTITDNPDVADLWLLNSCTVKGPAEDHFRNKVDSGLSAGKHVVVAGCVPQGAPRNSYLKGLSVVGTQQIDRIVEVVEETLKGHNVRLTATKKQNGRKMGGAKLDLPKIRKNPLVEIIAISTGCLNHCTYCKTKHARGELGSYPVSEIVSRAEQAFEEGVKELWITSEDTGAYGRDIGTDLPSLLRQLVRVVPDHCRLRLGMTNPPYILDHLQAMSEILSDHRVYSFLHIPVQSGSDPVLADMKREYCIQDFDHIVNFMKENVPGITICTDIICGFPTETEQDFEATMDLVERHQFPSLFINQFFPRPGTPAAKMSRVDPKEVKDRTKRLATLFSAFHPYADRIGREYSILVTETSHDGKHYVGHNKYYEQILVPKCPQYLGTQMRVKVVSQGKHFMMGQVLNEDKRSKFISNMAIGWKTMDKQNAFTIISCLVICIALFINFIFK